MSKIKELRGHHLINLFVEYIEAGKLPTHYHDWEMKIDYPIVVIAAVDDYCKMCRTHPAINLCKTKELEAWDQECIEFLGMEIGKKYNYREITKLFNEKRKELGIKRRTRINAYDLVVRPKRK